MSVKRFRPRPDDYCEFDAVRFTGDNADEVRAFIAQCDSPIQFRFPGDEGWGPDVFTESGGVWSVRPGDWIAGPRADLIAAENLARNYEEVT